jgi:hypothetical protein
MAAGQGIVDPATGSFRMGGMWGAAYDQSGELISEMVELQVPTELGRITVPLVGTDAEGYKQGRTTREGTMRVQKIDARWEMQVYRLLSRTIQERRADRDAGKAAFDPRFRLILTIDDPEALGIERWQYEGCRIWRIPNGFNIGDEVTEREYPVTWENERPITVFRQKKGAGDPQPEYVDVSTL